MQLLGAAVGNKPELLDVVVLVVSLSDFENRDKWRSLYNSTVGFENVMKDFMSFLCYFSQNDYPPTASLVILPLVGAYDHTD